MDKYGFIITRHVNSDKTNKYWNQCVKLIRTFYPLKQIIIIDDNSNQQFVSTDHQYTNLTVIQSEYPGRGELLPYIYFLKYKWFSNAVIIHDSVFIHRRIPFETINMPVLPLWHHEYDKENVNNLLRISSVLTNNYTIIQNIKGSEINVLGLPKSKDILCFGVQCYINLNFLELLENKYKITNLVNVVKNRTDRCGLERVLGILFCKECYKLEKVKSLFGDILRKKLAFKYTYDNYLNDVKNGIVKYPFVKVWTGR